MNLIPRQSRRTRNSVTIDGDKLTAARTTAGLTQVQLADAADLSQTYISALETGDRDRLSRDAYARLCHALGVGAGALLAEQPTP
jgi:transcriptional regulator with XRE-family HTH domain